MDPRCHRGASRPGGRIPWRSARNGAAARQLNALFHLGAAGPLTDGQLLERFATRSGEGAELAFAALVERHGPLVLRVCRSVLRDEHAAHDAFQATFLVLVDKGRSLWVRDSLAPWLHAVAYRVALCAEAPPLADGGTSGPWLGLTKGGSSKGSPRPANSGRCSTRRSRPCPSATGCRSCSATSKAARTTRRPGTWAGRSARSRAGKPGVATASGPGWSAGGSPPRSGSGWPSRGRRGGSVSPRWPTRRPPSPVESRRRGSGPRRPRSPRWQRRFRWAS